MPRLDGLDQSRHPRRWFAALAACTLSGATLPAGFAPRPAQASPRAAPDAYAPNCVNVVLRDALWGNSGA